MPGQSYRNPELVETVIDALASGSRLSDAQNRARAMLAEGARADELLLLLWKRWFQLDDTWERVTRILIEVLNSDDFPKLPRIGPVGVVRTSWDHGDVGDLNVELYTNDDILRGDRLPLVRLLPPSSDPESAGAPPRLEEIERAARPSKKRGNQLRHRKGGAGAKAEPQDQATYPVRAPFGVPKINERRR